MSQPRANKYSRLNANWPTKNYEHEGHFDDCENCLFNDSAQNLCSPSTNNADCPLRQMKDRKKISQPKTNLYRFVTTCNSPYAERYWREPCI